MEYMHKFSNLKKYIKPDQHYLDVHLEMCKSRQTEHTNTVIIHVQESLMMTFFALATLQTNAEL